MDLHRLSLSSGLAVRHGAKMGMSRGDAGARMILSFSGISGLCWEVVSSLSGEGSKRRFRVRGWGREWRPRLSSSSWCQDAPICVSFQLTHPTPLLAGGLGTSTLATVGCSTCWRREITRTTATLGPLTPRSSPCVASATCSGTSEAPSTPPSRAPTSPSPGARPTTQGPPDTRVNKVWLATCLLWVFSSMVYLGHVCAHVHVEGRERGSQQASGLRFVISLH